MKKILSLLCVSILSIVLITSGCAFSFSKKNTKVQKQSVSVSEPVKQNIEQQDNVWCITFQLVWNEFLDKMLNGKPAQFIDGNPAIANKLNKRLYSKKDISENSYYVTSGKISKSLKKEIEQAIAKKFNEKSDILNQINWNVQDGYLFYAMLKKVFTFENAFDILEPMPFNYSKENVKFFGIKEKSDKKLCKNVNVLFYDADADEYAVKLVTKENEEVILYRTDSKDSFENLFADVNKKTKKDEFTKYDILQIPEINVDETISYDELCGKAIKNTNYVITQALQTIKFKMDNKGGTLKSEAAMVVMKTALRPEDFKRRYFLYDKPFVLFLVEKDKNNPYFAMRVQNTDSLVISSK